MTSQSQRPLEGRVALITGAARRPGPATAFPLAEHGATVALNVPSPAHRPEATHPSTQPRRRNAAPPRSCHPHA